MGCICVKMGQVKMGRVKMDRVEIGQVKKNGPSGNGASENGASENGSRCNEDKGAIENQAGIKMQRGSRCKEDQESTRITIKDLTGQTFENKIFTNSKSAAKNY